MAIRGEYEPHIEREQFNDIIRGLYHIRMNLIIRFAEQEKWTSQPPNLMNCLDSKQDGIAAIHTGDRVSYTKG